ncbi:Gryzun, putative trafficking through golgi-domain-containing protein [Xylogone sp. PMI_703]|nr:Gryzun, putative trafficking through golgi-domain-containing protein [Xylogone sp. PMI_703]
MDDYAPQYIAHNVPLLVVSGLGLPEPLESQDESQLRSDGPQISSNLPIVDTEDARALLKFFQDSDATKLAWNSREHGKNKKFKIKAVGRSYTLPPRRSQTVSGSSIPFSPRSPTEPPKPVVHSPLSPLTPGSPLFPDGLMDPRWIDRHQEQIPSAYISFYAFESDPNMSSLHDNHMKTDINQIKEVLSRYKTRLIVALMSDKSTLQAPDIEDRLTNIRRATGLDPKASLFFLPPNSSTVELQAFVETIQSTIYPLSIEYYRDLSKRLRKKRNRGVVASSTTSLNSGTSQSLSSQGWNVRYDFKLGVFAEFRQEMDGAVRAYESSYDTLFGPEVFEVIANWNPRWDEARLLADVIAIRILRCLLWLGTPTAAVRRWQHHRDRVRDLVDRRGKGSSTYGWEAWESRWSLVMAEVIKKAEFPDFTASPTTIFLAPEKVIPTTERLQPWEHLHHPGYWFQMAANHLSARRALALAIPEEDRSPPGSSPASKIASKAYTYDTYLCPEPHIENPLPGHQGVDHSQLIIDVLKKAIPEFDRRGQSRLTQEVQLQLGRESLRQGSWNDAFRLLRTLWQTMSYRREGWWPVVEEVAWALRTAAARVGDGGVVLAVDWELLDQDFSPRRDWRYNIMKSLDSVENIKIRPNVILRDQEIHSFLCATHVFEHTEGKVGETCASQLAVTSNALSNSAPITFDEIRIEFQGSMKPIVLRHKAIDEPPKLPYHKVSLSENAPASHDPESTMSSAYTTGTIQEGECDLSILPGATKVFEFNCPLREAGDAKAKTARFSINNDKFDLEYSFDFERRTTTYFWYDQHLATRKVARLNPSAITVLPKPPKMELRFLDLQEQYYTNEHIHLRVEVVNLEESDSVTHLQVQIRGENTPQPLLRVVNPIEGEWYSGDGNSCEIPLETILASKSTIVEISIPAVDIAATFEVATKAAYRLVSDMETPVSCSTSIQLPIVNPFEANYDFSPRIHPDPWPSYFTHEESEDFTVSEQGAEHATGLAQRWCLTTRYASFALETLVVEEVDVDILGTNGGIYCNTKGISEIPDGGLRISPKSIEEAQFDVFTRKHSLDDRGTATLDVCFVIRWRRDKDNSPVNATILPVPRLLVSSSEPRVLGAVSYSETMPSMIHFDVTIENPSNHFLTFSLAMEPSEEFAFSGIKQSIIQLVPLSRRTVRFRLLPFVRGTWIGPIRCVIRDRYFQKVLKVSPTEGMKPHKDGVLVWVPLEEEGE